MPVLTNDEAASGFIGSIVVCARLKEKRPEKIKNKPRIKITIIKESRTKKGNEISKENVDIPHISRAHTKAIIGGGILFSSMAYTIFYYITLD